MSRTLAKVALVVGAVALVATGIGAVAGAAGLAGISAATFATVGTLAGVAAGGLALASSLTAKRPKAAEATGSQTNFRADPDAGIPVIIGRTAPAGRVVSRGGT